MADTEYNGAPVTWRELNLALQPLRDGHRRLESKVDEVLETIAENRGADRASRGFLDSRRWMITTIVLVSTSSVGLAILTFVLRSHQ